MNYILVFDSTGDEIPFVPLNHEVLEFYVYQLERQQLNKFFSTNQGLGKIILSKINALKLTVEQINEWLYDLADIKFDLHDTESYLDQNVLNKLHADWARSQLLAYDIQKKRKQFNFSGIAEQIHDMFPDDIQTPPLSVVLEKIGHSKIYYSLNDPHIHGVERLFNYIGFQVSDTWTNIANNPFPKTILTNDMANLRISFNHLGRTLYNKFENFDMNLDYDDENSYNELLGFVSLSLVPAQTVPMSKEYTNWCKQHNREPIGEFLNIGNIPDLYENLTKYRKIVFKNLLDNNSFSIHKDTRKNHGKTI